MSSVEMDALIIRHLADIDAATKRLYYNIQEQVGKAIDDVTESWTKQNEWEGLFNWDQEHLIVYPRQWTYAEPGSDKNHRLAWFELDAGQGDDLVNDDRLDYFWLTRLCRAGRGELALWWKYEKGKFALTRPKWKQFVRPYIEKVLATGFTYDESRGLFFLPVRVELQSLAQAIETEAIEDALQSIDLALNACLAAKPIFDEILSTAKAQFSNDE